MLSRVLHGLLITCDNISVGSQPECCCERTHLKYVGFITQSPPDQCTRQHKKSRNLFPLLSSSYSPPFPFTTPTGNGCPELLIPIGCCWDDCCLLSSCWLGVPDRLLLWLLVAVLLLLLTPTGPELDVTGAMGGMPA